ncbi:MAG: TcpQ domain-containing protein [Pusillimonas sp.]
MVRSLAAASIALVLLPACTGVPDWFPPALQSTAADKQARLAHYSFDWRLSGSREVAPLQVFDDGGRTWLQFAPQQPVPAIFELADGRARPLPYTREGPYIVLAGVWPQIMLRGGMLQSLATRTTRGGTDTAQLDAPTEQDRAAAGPGSAATVSDNAATATDSAPAAPEPAASTVAAGRVPLGGAQAAAVLVPAPVMRTALQDAPVPGVELQRPATAESYEVSPRDVTLRAALARWAGLAGWTFEPEHWAMDVDIPIVGSASFALPFKQAVQELVASTELADRPLQPCFYSNRVLRIVPYAQPCDRSAGPAGAS